LFRFDSESEALIMQGDDDANQGLATFTMMLKEPTYRIQDEEERGIEGDIDRRSRLNQGHAGYAESGEDEPRLDHSDITERILFAFKAMILKCHVVYLDLECQGNCKETEQTKSSPYKQHPQHSTPLPHLRRQQSDRSSRNQYIVMYLI